MAPELTLDNLLSALDAASSQTDTATRESGEKLLQELQTAPGYYAALQNVYIDRAHDQSRRWLSIILLKNGTQTHWRKTAKDHISDAEKSEIRNRLFINLSEPNRQLLMQNATTVSQIARIDFPREWPDLFDQLSSILMEAINEQNLVKLYNTLYILNQVLKVLASVKFGRSKPAMQERATDLLRKVSPIYISLVNEWKASPREFDIAKMEVSYLALKVLSRLMYDGHDYINRTEDTVSFFGTAQEHLRLFLELYDSPSHQLFNELLAKLIKQLGKLFLRLYDKQASSFVLADKSAQVLEIYLSVIISKAPFLYRPQADDDNDDGSSKEMYERVVVQGLELLQGMIKIADKSPATSVRGRTEQDRFEANEARTLLKSHILTKDLLSNLLDTVLRWYFRLSYTDLENWSSDPEEFFIDESEMVVSPTKIRPIAVGLYQTMLMAYKDDLTGQVLHFIERTLTIEDDSLDAVLIKDTALQAFENGSGSFGDVCDFVSMFRTILAPQALVTSPDQYRIIRRRLCLVFPEWIYLITDQGILVDVYKILSGFLDKSNPLNDLVVRLYAIQSLRYCVDNYEFKPDSFAPFTEEVFTAIFELCGILEHIEAKNILLSALSVMFDQLGSVVVPYIDGVLRLLPPLWEDSTDNYIINGVILQTLTNIIAAAKEKSTSCYPMAIPAIRASIDPSSPLNAYLLEDALPLWKALLENAGEPSNELFSLLPDLLTSLEKGEEFASVLDILRSYIILAPQTVLTNEFNSKLCSIFASYISAIDQNSFTKLIEIVGLISLVLPLVDYVRPFFDTHLFADILKVLFDDGVVTMITVTQILSVFSRMAFQNSSLFLELIDSTGESDKILNLWITKFDHMGHPRDRKLNGLGLASLASTGNPMVLSKLPQLVDIWSQLLDEVNEVGGDSEAYYGAFEYVHPGDEPSPEQKRLKLLSSSRDPVHSISALDAIKSTLHRLSDLPPEHRLYIEAMDAKVLAAINSILER
ncbi:Kap120p [Sugiyamaella lignohabitans]|uniref:Kap120p n=1 Tax=Sugiyamaella lignohabitans TaxID=796027 RepID=A0A167DV28_9ASCO|nr:Kap120p [Sugiyamaella lignohabitans]ANB13326.1 Kap120p [Sugiyamaella lignohabitans]